MNRTHAALPWIVALVLTIVLFASVDRFMDSIAPESIVSPVARRYFALNEQAAALSSQLRSMVMVDSVNALVPAKPSFFVGALDHNSDGLAELRERASRELRDTSKAVVGVVATPVFWMGLDGFPNLGDGRAFFTGMKGSTPYCVASVEAYDSKSSYDEAEKSGVQIRRQFYGLRQSPVLGPCGFYGQYGPPGNSVARWLTAGNARLYVFNPAEYEFQSEQRQRVFFQFGPRYYDLPIAARACAARRLDKCEHAFADVPHRSNRLWNGDVWGGGVLPSQTKVLNALEREFGQERFARFWTSDGDISTAFATAFGVPAGEWVYGQTNPYKKYVHATPRMSMQTILLTLVIVGLIFALTLSTTNRRVI